MSWSLSSLKARSLPTHSRQLNLQLISTQRPPIKLLCSALSRGLQVVIYKTANQTEACKKTPKQFPEHRQSHTGGKRSNWLFVKIMYQNWKIMYQSYNTENLAMQWVMSLNVLVGVFPIPVTKDWEQNVSSEFNNSWLRTRGLSVSLAHSGGASENHELWYDRYDKDTTERNACVCVGEG